MDKGPGRGLHRHASAREEGGGAHSHRGLKQSFVVVVNALIIKKKICFTV